MSGPKVVRVVTKEELIGRCESAMARLSSACRDLSKAADRADALSSDLQATILRVQQDLKTEMNAGRVHGLQVRIESAEAFIRSEKERVFAEAQRRLEQQREKQRLLVAGAKTLAAALEVSNPEMAEQLLRASEDQTLTKQNKEEALSRLISAAYSALSKRIQVESLRTDASLAQRLASGMTEESLSAWLAKNAVVPAVDARLGKLLVQIELLGVEPAAALKERAGEIEKESDDARRALLTDSLIIDLAAVVRQEQRLGDVTAKADAAQIRLEQIRSAECQSAHAQLQLAMQRGQLDLIEAALELADKVLASEDAQLAAESRRAAVLDGLRTLGYRVDQTMVTAWSSKGRIVVAKPGVADYGVEIGATPDAQTMQVRLVGASVPSTPRSRDRDTKMETTWCSEFSKLQKLMASVGSEIQIKKAIGVGVEPVRSVDTSDIERARVADVVRPSDASLTLKG